MKNTKNIVIIIFALAIVLMIVNAVVRFNIKTDKLNKIKTEQAQYLSSLNYVERYETSGDSVTVYVTDKWLSYDSDDLIKWCNTVGDNVTNIYKKYIPDYPFVVYVHVCKDNKNNTVSQLAYYRGDTELYYK